MAKEINIIEVNVSNFDFATQYCFNERNEKYYIAFETNVNVPYSVLFKDLNWLRKHYGIDNNENSIITKESLNSGRKNEIKNFKLALKANVPMWELGKVNNDGSIKINSETGEPYKVYKLSDEAREQFQNYIDKGLLVLCEIVK